VSSRARCSLNYDGMRYATFRQAVQVVANFYRQGTGKYYLVKKGVTPMWRYLVEMVEKTPDWPEGAKLKIWREKRGRKRRVRVVEEARRGTATTRIPPMPVQPGGHIRFTGVGTGRTLAGVRRAEFRNGIFYREIHDLEVPRAER